MLHDGDFVFAIYDKNLDFDYISKHMKLMPVRITKRGQQLNKGRKAAFDCWSYKKRIRDWTKMDEVLVELLDDLLEHKEFIHKLKTRYPNMRLTCYVRSDYGQIGFDISREAIAKLSALDIGICFDILSFGMVE